MHHCRSSLGVALLVCASLSPFVYGWNEVSGGRLNEVMVDDFEDGVLHEVPGSPLPSGYGWQKTSYAGQYTWAIDSTQGGNGTSKSMKVTCTSTVPYWYYINPNSRDTYILDGYDRPLNRMEYYTKLPQNWMMSAYTLPGSMTYCYANWNIGTYARDPNVTLSYGTATETYGWHFYYGYIFNMYDTSWVRVQLNQWPGHMRNDHKTCNAYPGKPQGDVFSNWTRGYFCGVPYTTDPGVGYPYDMWFDQWCFYYENEYVTMNPEYGDGQGTPGSAISYPVTAMNTHPTETREFGFTLSSELFNGANYWTYNIHLYLDTNGDGIHQANETTEPTSTGTLQPGQKWRGVLVATIPTSGAGSEIGSYVVTALTAWQKTPAYAGLDPHISRGRIEVGGVAQDDPATVLPGTPCAGAQFVTRTVASVPAADTVAPAAIDDLCLLAIGPHDAKVGWTAIGNDGEQGVAYAYDARYSTSSITPANWDSATELTGEADVWPAGVAQTWWLPPVLQSGTTYYLAIKVRDQAGNTSGLSNVVSFTATTVRAGNASPVAGASANVTSGQTPLSVNLSSSSSADSDGTIVLRVWDFGDGVLSNAASPSHTFDIVGTNTVRLTVFDNNGASHQTSLTITTSRGASGRIMLRNGLDGYASGLSNMICAGSPTAVNLGGTTVRVGYYGNKNRGLFQFGSLQSSLGIPANGSITAAALLLYEQPNPNADKKSTDLQLYSIESYTPSQASWNSKATSTPWTTAGAITDVSQPYTSITADGHALMQRSWDVTSLVSAGQDTFNVALRTPDELSSRFPQFATHGCTNVTQRPTLLVSYVCNGAPTVNAGNDQTITLPAAANLDGTASDDGLPNPPGAVTVTWSKVSGPGTVTFGNANAVDTTATFSASGTYVLQLLANDGVLQTTDTVTVTVNSGSLTVLGSFSINGLKPSTSSYCSGGIAFIPANEDSINQDTLVINWRAIDNGSNYNQVFQRITIPGDGGTPTVLATATIRYNMLYDGTNQFGSSGAAELVYEAASNRLITVKTPADGGNRFFWFDLFASDTTLVAGQVGYSARNSDNTTAMCRAIIPSAGGVYTSFYPYSTNWVKAAMDIDNGNGGTITKTSITKSSFTGWWPDTSAYPYTVDGFDCEGGVVYGDNVLLLRDYRNSANGNAQESHLYRVGSALDAAAINSAVDLGNMVPASGNFANLAAYGITMNGSTAYVRYGYFNEASSSNRVLMLQVP